MPHVYMSCIRTQKGVAILLFFRFNGKKRENILELIIGQGFNRYMKMTFD